MKVAIAGYGVEGEASYQYYVSLGHEVTIVDEHESPKNPLPEGAKTIIGTSAFEKLDDYDLVIRTPSLPPYRINTKGNIWSATNEFFDKCPAMIIGVTGTKGKGTTASLIASILRASGRKVYLVGNIGLPALTALPEITKDDVVVYELSSFQLWDAVKSPQIAVVLMIEPDHLDVHESFEEYIEAKSNIVRHQTSDGVAIYHPTNPYAKQIAESGQGVCIPYGTPDGTGAYVEDDMFKAGGNDICPVGELKIPGVHNQDNACAAITATMLLSDDTGAIATGLRTFEGLPHRLKFVAEKNGVKYYDDSIATTPGSAIAAMKAFKGPKVIILGGSDKGAEYDNILTYCKDNNVSVIAIGETGRRIYKQAQAMGIEVRRVEGLMDEVVAAASEMSEEGGVVILSPASASFDQYKSYADRGESFVAAVSELW